MVTTAPQPRLTNPPVTTILQPVTIDEAKISNKAVLLPTACCGEQHCFESPRFRKVWQSWGEGGFGPRNAQKGTKDTKRVVCVSWISRYFAAFGGAHGS